MKFGSMPTVVHTSLCEVFLRLLPFDLISAFKYAGLCFASSSVLNSREMLIVAF